MEQKYMHEVVATALIIKNGKYLIIRRSMQKKRFPGLWTIPGGHLETADYSRMSPDEKGYWRGALESVLRREVREEVGVEIANIRYLTSVATIHSDGSPSIVISCTADFESGDIQLQEDETDKAAWIYPHEIEEYRLLGSIGEEIRIAEARRLALPVSVLPSGVAS